MNFFQNLDDITMNIEENGVEISREIDRIVLERRGWATVAIAYQERKKEDEPFSGARFILLKLRSSGDGWKLESKFKISDAGAAEEIARFILRRRD